MNLLTNNAIPTMINQTSGNLEKFVVEATICKIIQDCMKLSLSDGFNQTKAIVFISEDKMDLRKVGKPFGENADKYLIKIVAFSTYEEKGKVFIQIQNFVALEAPRSRTDNTTVSIKKEVKIEEPSVRKDLKSSRPIEAIKTENKTPRREQQKEEMDIEEEAEADLDVNEIKKFDKIADLFVDIPAWEILVRVIEKSYREFNNKAGKPIKLFSMTLIDRTGMKIQGVMFGDNAKHYHELIRVNGIYRMSRGQIREENYNQNKGDKYSRFNIIFNKGSVFIPIKDLPQIPRAQDTNVQLKELLGEWNFDRQFDIAGILLSIGEQRVYEKEGRNIYKKLIVIGDPTIMKSIEVVIWNQDLFVDPKWQNKTIHLKSFKLNSYKDALSLNSIFKSTIQPLPRHAFTPYEDKYGQSDFQNVSYTVKENNDTSNKYSKNIRDIEHEINFMNSNEVIYSDLEIWLTHASFKGKWYYEACNNSKCKKSTEAFSKCLHCGHYNDNTHKKFILPIEISDMTGSLWTTAFDEFAAEIFKGIPGDYLFHLDEAELKQEAQKRLYYQYKVRLSTKKESDGNIKHSIMGKPGEVNIQKSAINNVERIKKMLDV